MPQLKCPSCGAKGEVRESGDSFEVRGMWPKGHWPVRKCRNCGVGLVVKPRLIPPGVRASVIPGATWLQMEESWRRQFGDDDLDVQVPDVPIVGRSLTLADGTRAIVVFDFEGGAAPLPWDRTDVNGMILGTWAVFMDQDQPGPSSLLHVWDEGRRYVQIHHMDIADVREVAESSEVLVVEIRTAGGFVVMSGPPLKVREAIDFVGAELRE